jgi:hypothetical protein
MGKGDTTKVIENEKSGHFPFQFQKNRGNAPLFEEN